MEQNKGRFFFGFSIIAPWSESEPEGRMIAQPLRHMTTHFIGNIDRDKMDAVLPQIKISPFYFTGILDSLIYLPVHFPKNVSATIQIETGKEELKKLYPEVGTLLQKHQLIEPPKHKLLPHTSFCRAPYNTREWKKHFHQMPCYSPYFACFESDGNLNYKPYKVWPLLVPFEPIDHPADIAFRIHGRNPTEMFYHACLAIAFFHHPFSSYIPQTAPQVENVDNIIDELNKIISKVDGEKGCPMKAVSRHGKIVNDTWEMIVDV